MHKNTKYFWHPRNLPENKIISQGKFLWYSENVRDALLEDDELSPTEVAFMKGYDEAYRS